MFYKIMIVVYGSVGLFKEVEDMLIIMELIEVLGGLDVYFVLLIVYGRLG